VRRDPLADVDADAGDLPRRRRQPDPGEPFDTHGLELERRQCADQRLFEVAAVLLHVLPVAPQIEDRVADELARGVVGGLAAAVGPEDHDLGALRHVQLPRLRAAPERDHGRVLEQHHGVRERPLRHGRRERTLELERLLV